MKALDSLARLLATENLQVVRGNYSTASFDCERRILRIPSWDYLGKDASDLFISHEVGHALWTPASAIADFNNDPRLKGCPFSVINILEDVRIERMIQDKYPGLIAVYRRGYAELQHIDLFRLKGQDISKMSFFNRLNLYAKLKHAGIDIPMSESELDIYRKAYAAQTIKDVLDLAAELWKSQLESPKASAQPQKDGSDGDDSDSGDSTEKGKEGEGEGDWSSSGGEAGDGEAGEVDESVAEGAEKEDASEGKDEGESMTSAGQGENEGQASDNGDETDSSKESSSEPTSGTGNAATNKTAGADLKKEDFNTDVADQMNQQLTASTAAMNEASGTVIVSSDFGYALKKAVISYATIREARRAVATAQGY